MNRKRPIAIIVVVIIVCLGLWLGVFGTRDDGKKMLASGTVEATEARLGFLSTGRIEKIFVHEGDMVKTGDTLAILDRAEMQARHKQALAQAEAARALLKELERGTRAEEIAQARAASDASSERLEDARRDFERAKKLFDDGAISRETLDKARTNFDVAQNQHTEARERLRQLETGPRRERIDARRAELKQAEANVLAIEASLSNMVIMAPFDGLISVRHHEPGETVQAGTPILTLQNIDDRWVRIFVPERKIGAVHYGSPATITTDTYEGKNYSGEVTFISSEAEFTPKTVQTTEERVRLVYAVKVRITGDASHDLKPGMPADVELTLSP
ncbi:MAG: HlyD family secretion protein [Candidatus Glassbacteria bacterium]